MKRHSFYCKEGRKRGGQGRIGEEEEKKRLEKKGRIILFCLYSAGYFTVRTDKPCAAFNVTLFLNGWACIDEINALQSIL